MTDTATQEREATADVSAPGTGNPIDGVVDDVAELLRALVQVPRPRLPSPRRWRDWRLLSARWWRARQRMRGRPVVWLEPSEAAPATGGAAQEASTVARAALARLGVRYARLGTSQPTKVRAALAAAVSAWRGSADVAPGGLRTYSDLLRALDVDLSEVDLSRHRAVLRRSMFGGPGVPGARDNFVAWLVAAGTTLQITMVPLTQGTTAAVVLWLGLALLGVAVLSPLGRVVPLLRLQWLWYRCGQPGFVWDRTPSWHPTARRGDPVDGPAEPAEAGELLDTLLVTAVVRGLRWSYRRWWRPGNWPTGYPVLLAEPGPGGARTSPLATILRAHTGTEGSPLLLVVAAAPGEAVATGEAVAAADPAEDRAAAVPLARWRERLAVWPPARPDERVWRLLLPAGSAPDLPPPAVGAGRTAGGPVRSRAFWERPSRRWFAVFSAVGLAVVGSAVMVDVVGGPACDPDNPGHQRVWRADATPSQVSGQGPGSATAPARTEEIGYRLCGSPFADPVTNTGQDDVIARLRRYQQLIFAENLRVDDESRGERRRRQVLTLVAITALTTRPADTPAQPNRYGLDISNSVMPETEGLAGVYAAQRAINEASDDGPLLKIAVANAGGRGAHAAELFTALERLLDSDTSVLGAVVTLNSSNNVRSAISGVSDRPFTMATPTMTADGIGDGLPHFYQMISPNGQQAEVVVDYVRTVFSGARLVNVYPRDTPSGDLYIRSLATGLDRASRRAGRSVRLHEETWSDSGDLHRYCGNRYRPNKRSGDVLFYGGRYNDFGRFANDLVRACGARLPPLIVDDSTARLLSDNSLAAQVPTTLTFTLATKSIPLSCARLRAPGFVEAVGPVTHGPPPRRRFRDDIRALDRCTPQATNPAKDAAGLAGGWAAASYDATRVLHWAIGGALRPGDQTAHVDRERVTREVDRRLTGGTVPFGMNSPITFDNDRVSSDVRVSLYCVRDLSRAFLIGSPVDAVVEVMRSGTDYPADRPAPRPSACMPST